MYDIYGFISYDVSRITAAVLRLQVHLIVVASVPPGSGGMC